MKRTLVLASLLFAVPALAETKTIGIDGGIAMPTGDWGESVGFGFGALARFEMPVHPKIVFAARAGSIRHLEKDDSGITVSEVPLFAGARYLFNPTIYGVAELGFVNYRYAVDVEGDSMSESDTNLGMTLGAGYRSGKLDVRGGLFFPDVDNAGDAMAVMATVGYDISTL